MSRIATSRGVEIDGSHEVLLPQWYLHSSLFPLSREIRNAESSDIDASLLGFSARDLTVRAATATATDAAAAATTGEPAAGITVLGNGAGTVPRVALSRVLATTTRLREMLDPRARLSAGQPHCHPLERDEIAGKFLVAELNSSSLNPFALATDCGP